MGIANADYIIDGNMEGYVCSGLVIKSCGPVSIDAVRDGDGELFNVSTRYNNVSSYDEGSGRCTIIIKTGSATQDTIRALQLPDFMTKTDSGDYRKVDPEYLTFRCRRLN